MKTLLLLLLPIFSFCQIGINTPKPTAMLDVNGNARIRNIPAANQWGDLKLERLEKTLFELGAEY